MRSRRRQPHCIKAGDKLSVIVHRKGNLARMAVCLLYISALFSVKYNDMRSNRGEEGRTWWEGKGGKVEVVEGRLVL
jgi:hypothetical protein